MQQCILSFNNREEVLELPVPLQEWSADNPHNTYTFSTMETGDVLAIGAEQLVTMAISSEFPASKDYSYLYSKDFPEPWACVEMIKRWKKSKKPIRVIIVDTDINHAMAIENFKYGKGDRTKDVLFTLELKEYRFLNTPRSKNVTKKKIDKNGLRSRPSEKLDTTSHKVKKGDTMWDMSEKYLGDGKRWKEIAELNNMKDGWDLKVGQEIKIPPKDKVIAVDLISKEKPEAVEVLVF